MRNPPPFPSHKAASCTFKPNQKEMKTNNQIKFIIGFDPSTQINNVGLAVIDIDGQTIEGVRFRRVGGLFRAIFEYSDKEKQTIFVMENANLDKNTFITSENRGIDRRLSRNAGAIQGASKIYSELCIELFSNFVEYSPRRKGRKFEEREIDILLKHCKLRCKKRLNQHQRDAAKMAVMVFLDVFKI